MATQPFGGLTGPSMPAMPIKTEKPKFETKSSGYGMFTIGSKVEIFGGLNQSLFMGSKSATTVGFSNSFNLGPKTDFSMGPTVSFNFSPFAWDPKSAVVGTRPARFFAKYDFSNNKSFAFQISPEGSSTYATTVKFNCTQGFQAIGGLSSAGQAAFDVYTTLITKMGTAALISNSIMALANLAALGPAETNMSASKYKNEGATVALGVIPALINMGGIYAALTAAISVATGREDVFKKAIHAESVLQLTKQLAFIGSAGIDPIPMVPPAPFLPDIPRSGAGLQLDGGKATLSSRNIKDVPFKKKKNDSVSLASPWGASPAEYPGGPYVDFIDTPAAAVEVVPQQITAYGQTIKIAAGYVPDSAPPEVTPLPSAKFINPAAPPSLLLTATGPMAKIQAQTEGSFNVVAPTISLQTTEGAPPPSELTISAAGGVNIKHSLGSEISITTKGDIKLTHLNTVTSVNITSSGITIKTPTNSIELNAGGIYLDLLGKKIKFTAPVTDLGGLKLVG